MQYWDEWHEQAMRAGVLKRLAHLGRAMLRKQQENDRCMEFLGEPCNGAKLIDLCLEDPKHTEMLFLEKLYPHDFDFLFSERERLGLL